VTADNRTGERAPPASTDDLPITIPERADAASDDADRPAVSRREAAVLIGVHYNTIRKWERSGRIRSERRDADRTARSVIRIPVTEVERLRRERQFEANRDPEQAQGRMSAELMALREENTELRAKLRDLTGHARGGDAW
jgi:hypothetical protein